MGEINASLKTKHHSDAGRINIIKHHRGHNLGPLKAWAAAWRPSMLAYQNVAI